MSGGAAETVGRWAGQRETRMPKVPSHPGFKSVAKSIARERGVPMERANAMLAAGTRRAGGTARKRNPRLNRVKGY